MKKTLKKTTKARPIVLPPSKLSGKFNQAEAAYSENKKIYYYSHEVDIHPELQHWLTPNSEAIKAELEADILTSGKIKDSIVVWPHKDKLFVVDGHHRWEIAKKHNLPFMIHIRTDWQTIDEVKAWMYNFQDKIRRKLNDLQEAYYIGWEYDTIQKDPSGRVALLVFNRLGQNVPNVQTTDNQNVAPVIHVEHADLGQNAPNAKPAEYEQTRTSTLLAKRHGLGDEKSVRRRYDMYRGLEALKAVNEALFERIFTKQEPIHFGVVEKLAGVKIPAKVKTVADLKELVAEPKEAKAKDETLSTASTRVKGFFKKPTEKGREDALKTLRKLIAEIEHFKIRE